MSRAGSDLLVNHSYNSLAQGVSEQATEARHESQVEELENCIPHISRGIIRRNPINFITELVDKDSIPVVPENYYIYSYDRGTVGEQYVFLLGHRKWYVYNVDGTLVGSYNDTTNAATNLDYLDTGGKHPKETFSLVTVGDHTWISNNTIATGMSTQTDGLSTNFHKTIAVYTIKSTGNVVTNSDPSTGAVTLEGYKYEFKATYNDSAFPHVEDSGAVTGDNTNKTGDVIASSMAIQLNTGHTASTTVPVTEGPFYTFPSTYVHNFTDGGSVRTFYWYGTKVGTSATGTLVVGPYTYTEGDIKNTSTGVQYREISRTHQKVVDGDPLEGDWGVAGPVVYNKGLPESSVIEYNDSFGNTASYGFKGIVPSSGKLPDFLPTAVGEVIVKVDSSEEVEGGEYWLRWDGNIWAETLAPGLPNTIDHLTMPHTFLRASDGAFSFGFYGEFDGTIFEGSHFKPSSSKWEDRSKGDILSAPPPGFIGKKIDDMFIHNNRLGVLAEDAVTMSELSIYGNFFPTTVRTIPATDPIDLIVATSDVTGLKKAVSLSGLLLLFSDEAQFSVTGGGGSLTPESATVDAVSRYNYSDKAPARVLGNKVMFTTESGNGTQLFSFVTDALAAGSTNIIADSVSLHIPTYLPNNINYIATHSILGYLFMLSPDEPNTLFVLNTLEIGKSSVQTAFHKWNFGATIRGISVLNNALLMLMEIDNKLIGVSMDLDIPVDVANIEYQDEFESGVFTNYTSFVTLSKWFLKDAEGFGNKRGRLQIRTAQFSVGNCDSYKIEIFNDSIINPVPSEEDWVLTEAIWNDTAYWSFNETNLDDSLVIWKDALPFFSRIYYNDEKVTVTSNSDNTFIRFGSNDLEPTKGFTLSTVNLEGLFRQRSTRT